MLEEKLVNKALRKPNPLLYVVTSNGVEDLEDHKALALFRRRINGTSPTAENKPAVGQDNVQEPRRLSKLTASWEKAAPWGAAFLSGLFASAVWNIFFD